MSRVHTRDAALQASCTQSRWGGAGSRLLGAAEGLSQGDSSEQGPSNSMSRVERLVHMQLEAESQGSWQCSSSPTGTCSPGREGSFSALLTGLCQTDALKSVQREALQ